MFTHACPVHEGMDKTNLVGQDATRAIETNSLSALHGVIRRVQACMQSCKLEMLPIPTRRIAMESKFKLAS